MKNDIEKIILNNLKEPILFVDTSHIIRYMNKPATLHYDRGLDLIGTSIFDCHNKNSNDTILTIFAKMKSGLIEELITDNQKHRIYMRSVRDDSGQLLGYFERYEPAIKK